MSDGKLTDVLIEECMGCNPITGVEFFSCLKVWADENMTDIIMAVPGVCNMMFNENPYLVDLDKRYDRNWVAAEIEAAIKCAPKGRGDE